MFKMTFKQQRRNVIYLFYCSLKSVSEFNGTREQINAFLLLNWALGDEVISDFQRWLGATKKWLCIPFLKLL